MARGKVAFQDAAPPLFEQAPFARPVLDYARNLPVRPLHAVTETHGVYPPVVEHRPGIHRHRVGVVQEKRPLPRYLADVPAEIEDGRDVALPVHDPARAEGVPHALVHAILQRDVDVLCKRFEPPDARAVHHVVRPRERPATVTRRDDLGWKMVISKILLADPRDHLEVPRVDVGECELRIPKLRNNKDVAE